MKTCLILILRKIDILAPDLGKLFYIISFFFQTSQPTLEIFEDLIDKNPETFYPLRTPKTLHNHWLLMKQYHLLPDQSGWFIHTPRAH